MNEFKKNYEPKYIEDKWYKFWEDNGFFKPNLNAPRESFCIVMPPPNVTGSLHMGHALNITIQDILTRWKRMSGFKVLWLPGTDHAGIATQNVVERELSKKGLDRHKLGRDAFIQEVWKWKSEYGERIIHQLKKMGASCDWTRQRFTLDEGLSRAVREVFIRLFEEGLIYRDHRLINWCPRCLTALSDLEVEYEEIEGKLYFIRYPLSSDKEADYITVATTRPETMLGDTAVAVNPEDNRYIQYIGKFIDLPLTGRKIPIIADSSVDSLFGTGAVKVTPAHDFNDEALGRVHNLPFISVMTEEGIMSREAGDKYFGLDRYECRKAVIKDLKELDLFEGEKRHVHSVGHCYRCKTIIEPMLTVQWYVNIKPLASKAVKVVQDRDIRLIPESWENNYFAWMKDIRDWCISRQIWWGHQIPAWYCPDCRISEGQRKVEYTENKDEILYQGDLIEHIFFKPLDTKEAKNVIGGTYSELRRLGIGHEEIIKNTKMMRIPKDITPICSRDDLTECPKCKSKNIIRDPDVLDTWFSSALWPFSTLGWPDETDDLRTFYPTNVLVTGFDILFFWVARMIMMGLKCMGDIPFRDVYIHALVRDIKGQKMSKSKGNVVDPLLMIEKYGTDAFRFTLAAFAAQGRDVRFSEDRVEGYRHFINKLWNATRFIVSAGPQGYEPSDDVEELDLPSKWIMSRLAFAVEEVNKNLFNYRFNDAASSIYQFVWHEFCDWYIEISKSILYNGEEKEKKAVINCLYFVLKNILKLLHPFMPFVTEEIWSHVFKNQGSIMISSYPVDLQRDFESERKANYILDVVKGIRSIRGELNISPSVEIKADIKTFFDEVTDILKENHTSIAKLTRCKEINIGKEIKRPKGSAIYVSTDFEIYVQIEDLLDINQEIKRLNKELGKINESITFLNKKLMNEDFLRNAPREIVAKEKKRFDELVQKKEKVEDNIRLFMTILSSQNV